jgi:glyoxylase-like metal-dependent hydrolase (beta-lactamase superfamily II)
VRDVFFLTCGTMRVPSAGFSPGWSIARMDIPLVVAVVVRDSGDVLLVDAGWSEEACEGVARVYGRLRSVYLGARTRRDDAVVRQLARLGIARDRVKAIVATHLHLDHVGGVEDFPDAEVVCTDAELSAHRARKSPGYFARDLERARVRAVALAGAPTYGFPASHDLFGDGEVTLLDARGHTQGSCAVALRAREQCYVHLGDAVYQTWEHGLSPAGPSRFARITAWSRSQQRATYEHIRACEADPRRPILVPSHDMTTYRRLPHAPTAA